MQTLLFENITDQPLCGFRLHRLEVYNWGTFNRQVWDIAPGGHNALLTGDIGSGKSTMVDAVTTLLVPHNRIIYNKAAGAVGRERDLYSYIRGEYKSEKDDLTQSAKAVPLRGDESFTVLLAYFHNSGLNQGVTLAQVFWIKDQRRNPERFFVVVEGNLGIASHFSDFGNDILELKKRLKRLAQVKVLDNFKEYSTQFRRLFGIQNEQALELFYQTVSMKSVGNLTEFVRNHMLDSTDMEGRVKELCNNFDNLNRLHEAVLKAKRQVSQLIPLVENGTRYLELNDDITIFRGCRDALPAYFAFQKQGLLTCDIERLGLELKKTTYQLVAVKEEIDNLRLRENELSESIKENGGGRLDALAAEIAATVAERDRRRQKEEGYQRLAGHAGLQPARTEVDFFHNRTEAEQVLDGLTTESETIKKGELDLSIQLNALKEERKSYNDELDSLRRRTSSIPLKQLTLRSEMAKLLKVAEERLPFAGELLSVAEEEESWEGAIERVMHNFGLTLLVPDDLYPLVSHYVDKTNLGARLVYYRVQKASHSIPTVDTDPASLKRKLRIKPDTTLYDWLEQHLAERFDYICCDDMDAFRKHKNAITMTGQIKNNGVRHEKDDRRSIYDRGQYVLGWSNQGKIKALEDKKLSTERTSQTVALQLANLDKQLRLIGERRDALRDLLNIDDYTSLSWQPLVEKIELLENERVEIERSSDMLKLLREHLEAVRGESEIKEKRRSELDQRVGKFSNQLETQRNALNEAITIAGTISDSERQTYSPRLDNLHREVPDRIPLTLNNYDKQLRETREILNSQFDSLKSKCDSLMLKIVKQMMSYKEANRAETDDVDASIDSISEFAGMLKNLQEQDLPRHESRFKQQLNVDTINDIVLFQNQLEKEKQQINEKIGIINSSLKGIEYSSGTYIELIIERTQDPEVRDFQQELKQCLSNTLDDTDLYNEAKFLQVKAIIDRFNGREGNAELDRRWTRKVTDVRNWFLFSASECWLEDGKQKEYYSDTAGKSGGQKEKLAYTILASALAYQFGLDRGTARSRSFRFVVIDEAFGKGSDESTRYALELFKKLDLQLLIVTPLQKIHVIEDYIRSVHFVFNENGSNSMLRNLTIDEYNAEKELFLKQAQS